MPTKEKSINFLAKHVAKPILSFQFQVYLNHLIPSLVITLDSFRLSYVNKNHHELYPESLKS